MELLRPAALLLLPLLLLLLLMLRRWYIRRPRPATTWMLLARAQASVLPPPPQRLLAWRDLWLLAPAITLVFGLAEPQLPELGKEAPLVVIVDRSASMGARRGGETLLAAGLARVPQRIPGGYSFLSIPPFLVAAGETLHVPTAATVSDQELARLAKNLLERRERVCVLSDHLPEGLPGEAGVLVVAPEGTNLGITAFSRDDSGRLLVRVEGETTGATLRITETDSKGGEARVLWKETFVPGPHRYRKVVTDVRPGASSWIRAQLSADANPLDDVAVLVPTRDPPRIGFPLDGHAALHRAFTAHPRLVTYRGDGHCELRVGDRPGAFEGFVLWVAPGAPPGVALGPPQIARGSLVGEGRLADAAHGQLELPALHSIRSMTPDQRVLLRVGTRPLLVLKGRDLLLLQDPEGSTWRHEESFPLVFAIVVQELGLTTKEAWSTHRGAAAISVLTPGPSEAVLEDPGGRLRSLRASPDGRFRFVLETAGVSTLRLKGPESQGPRVYATAVLSPEETQGRSGTFDQWRPGSTTNSAPRENRSLTPWLLLLAAALLLATELPGLLRRRPTGAG